METATRFDGHDCLSLSHGMQDALECHAAACWSLVVVGDLRKEEAGGPKASRAGGTRHMAARAGFANHVPICGPPPSTTGSEVNCIGIRGFRLARVIVHFHHALFPCLGYSIAVLDFSLVFICGWCGFLPRQSLPRIDRVKHSIGIETI